MSEAAFRAFVGLPLPKPVRQSLVEVQSRFREACLRASWVAPENFHITLRYLGNIRHADLDVLDGALREALERCPALHVALAGTGAFPARRPSVAWAGLEVFRGSPEALYRAASAGAASIGLAPEDRPFHPHVTLFRLRRGRNQNGRLEPVLGETESFRGDDFWVDSVAVWKSELRRGGAVYHRLKEYPLQCLRPSS